MVIPTKADDERLLKWIKLRSEGVPASAIAERFGTREEWVRVVTNRALAADIKHCGPQVALKYWDRKSGPKR